MKRLQCLFTKISEVHVVQLEKTTIFGDSGNEPATLLIIASHHGTARAMVVQVSPQTVLISTAGDRLRLGLRPVTCTAWLASARGTVLPLGHVTAPGAPQ